MGKVLFSLAGASILCVSLMAQDVTGGKWPASLTAQSGERVGVQEITLSLPTGTATAHVYIPKTNNPLPGVVFSHSRVKYANGESETDLLPLAVRVAKAGAAVIIVDRSLVWPSAGLDTNRGGADFTIAALHWLLANANVDSERCAYVGPKFKDPADPGTLRLLGPEDGIHSSPWVPIGESNDQANMTKLNESAGQVKIEQFLQRHLKFGSAGSTAAIEVTH